MTFSSIRPRTSLLHLRTPSISSFYGDRHMGRLLPFGLYLGLFTFAHDFVVHPCRRYSRIKAAPTASLWASLPLGFILVLYPRVLQTLSSLSSSTPWSCSLSDDNPRRHRRSSTRSLKLMPCSHHPSRRLTRNPCRRRPQLWPLVDASSRPLLAVG